MSAEQKQMARELYVLSGWTGKRIASALKVTEKTVSIWKTDGEWDKAKSNYAMNKSTSEEALRELIAHQIACIKKIKDDQLAEGKMSLISAKDVDGLAKLVSTIKSKNLTLDQIITVLREFMEMISVTDGNLAKSLIPYVDEFIGNKKISS